jgi:hypothetical protein
MELFQLFKETTIPEPAVSYFFFAPDLKGSIPVAAAGKDGEDNQEKGAESKEQILGLLTELQYFLGPTQNKEDHNVKEIWFRADANVILNIETNVVSLDCFAQYGVHDKDEFLDFMLGRYQLETVWRRPLFPFEMRNHYDSESNRVLFGDSLGFLYVAQEYFPYVRLKILAEICHIKQVYAIVSFHPNRKPKSDIDYELLRLKNEYEHRSIPLAYAHKIYLHLALPVGENVFEQWIHQYVTFSERHYIIRFEDGSHSAIKGSEVKWQKEYVTLPILAHRWEHDILVRHLSSFFLAQSEYKTRKFANLIPIICSFIVIQDSFVECWQRAASINDCPPILEVEGNA